MKKIEKLKRAEVLDQQIWLVTLEERYRQKFFFNYLLKLYSL